MHYYRQRRTGTLGSAESTKRWTGLCRYAGCPRTDAGGDGWCRLHAYRVRVHGDPDTVGQAQPTPGAQHPQWQGEDVGYSGAHMRSEEHTSELQSLIRISYVVFFFKN